MCELHWHHQTSATEPKSATRSGPQKELYGTRRIVAGITLALIASCMMVVLLGMVQASANEPLDADTGDSFLGAYSAPARTIHVDACDAGPGVYSTLTGAVAAASSGDTIVIHGGSYPETPVIRDKTLTITASDGPALVGSYHVGWKDVRVPILESPPTFAEARVYYPSTAPGGETVIDCRRPFPTVVYAHGRRDPNWELCEWCDEELQGAIGRDYLQAKGILTRLAGSGIIAISVDHSWALDLLEKEDVVLKTIAYLKNETEGAGWLKGAVRLDRVGLAGHSTGGGAVYRAARLSTVPIKGLGLIAPTCPRTSGSACLGSLDAEDVPVLVIHGTNEGTYQVRNNAPELSHLEIYNPLEIYCETAARNKHLIVVTGANHFGYTDGLCLDWRDNPDDPPDPASTVGDMTGQKAHALQHRTAGNYVHAFFSRYLQGNAGALDYLLQKEGEQPGHPGDWLQCVSDNPGTRLDPSDCVTPNSTFIDLESQNVEVRVCSYLGGQ